MADRTANLIVRLRDMVSGPARAASKNLRSIRTSMNGLSGLTAGERLAGAIARNNASLASYRFRMLDAVGAAYMLERAVGGPARAAMEFESAMADVRKVVDFPTPAAFRQMSADVIDLSKQLPMAATGIAAIVAAAGQSGMEGGELLQFAELATKVGIAFDMTADQTGTALAKIKTALGLSVADTSALADALNHLSNTSASAAPDLIDFMSRVGAQGAQFGFTAEQTAAIGSAMVAAGAEANVAATSFRNMGRALTMGEAATKAQRTAFAQLGLDAKEVAAGMQRDAVGTMNDVIARLREVPAEMRAATLSQLFGNEARAIAPLIENADLLAQALGNVADQAKYLGSAQREYEERAKTTANQLQLFRNQATALGIAIGSAILPPINEFAAAVGPLIGRLAELATAYPQVTSASVGLIGGLVALRVATAATGFAFYFMKGGVLDVARGALRAAGLVSAAAVRIRAAIAGAMMLSAVGGGGGMFAGLIAGVAGAASAIKVAVVGIIAAIAGITAPVALVIGAVAAVALAIYNYWEPISNFVSGFGEVIGSALSGVASSIAGFGAEIASAVGGWAADRLVDIGEWIGLDPAAVRSRIDGVVSVISGLPGAVMGALSGLGGTVRQWFADIFTINDYAEIDEAAFRDAGRAAAEAMLQAGKDIGNALWDGLKSIFGSIVAWVKEKAAAIFAPISGIANRIRGVFGGGGDTSSGSAAGPTGARRRGGPVSRGGSYLVGEEHAELFTPSRSGYIHPTPAPAASGASASPASAGSGSSPITVHFAPVINVADGNAGQVVDQIREVMRDEVRESFRGLLADTGMRFA